jgi:hypothetical protein
MNRLEDRFRELAAHDDDAGDGAGASVLRHCAHIADMVRRVGEFHHDAPYRKEKALSLLEGALDLVSLLAEQDGPDLDEATYDRLYDARRAWVRSTLETAFGMWGGQS